MARDSCKMTQPRVILWSVPRSLSTAFERSVMELKNVKTIHEAHNNAYFFGPERMTESQINHPDDIQPNATFEEAKQQLLSEYDGYDAVFAKNQAYFIEGRYEEYIEGSFSRFKHTFLMRHPLKAVPSRYNICKQCNLRFNACECGFRQLYELYNIVKRVDPNPLLLDADDLLSNPREMMEHYCFVTGLPFQEHMLSWKPGVVHEGWTSFRHSDVWFKDVANSAGFIKPKLTGAVVADYSNLEAEAREVVEYSLPYYDALYPLRMKPTLPLTPKQ